MLSADEYTINLDYILNHTVNGDSIHYVKSYYVYMCKT